MSGHVLTVNVSHIIIINILNLVVGSQTLTIFSRINHSDLQCCTSRKSQ